MIAVQCLPATPLRAFVREYWYREVDYGSRTLAISLPARPEQFLEFGLGNRYEVIDPPHPRRLAPVSAVVGTQAFGPIQVFLSGFQRNVTIHFHPTGFHRLFGLPMTDLACTAAEADDLIGRKAEALRQRLGEQTELPAMATLLDEFLLPFAARALAMRDPSSAAIERAARRAMTLGGSARLDALVESSGLGLRQFERRFKQGLGLSPKHYLRVARFHQALAFKRAHPEWSWGRVAAESEYHDQMHLVHDFRALAGEPPRRLLEGMDERSDGLTTVRTRMSAFY